MMQVLDSILHYSIARFEYLSEKEQTSLAYVCIWKLHSWG